MIAMSKPVTRILPDGRVIDMTPQPDPTENEIAERCAEIQRGWTHRERTRRIVFGREAGWIAPEYIFDGETFS